MDAWVQLIQSHGPAFALTAAMGGTFLAVGRRTLYGMLGRMEQQDLARANRENRTDEERRELTRQIIDLTKSATTAIEVSTREMIEFRRDTSHALRAGQKESQHHSDLLIEHAKESRERYERLQLQNQEIRAALVASSSS